MVLIIISYFHGYHMRALYGHPFLNQVHAAAGQHVPGFLNLILCGSSVSMFWYVFVCVCVCVCARALCVSAPKDINN